MSAARANYGGFMIVPNCAHCNRPEELVTGKTIYPHRRDLHAKWLWRCVPCKAHVGCHGLTTNPLGCPSNKELRDAKMAAHAAFDPVWQLTSTSRKDAYKWLADQLGVHEIHIGQSDIATCKRIVEVCRGSRT